MRRYGYRPRVIDRCTVAKLTVNSGGHPPLADLIILATQAQMHASVNGQTTKMDLVCGQVAADLQSLIDQYVQMVATFYQQPLEQLTVGLSDVYTDKTSQILYQFVAVAA